MSYDNIYQKLMANYNGGDRTMGNKGSIKKTSVQAYQIGEESQSSFTRRTNDKYVDQTLEALSLNYPLWTISLEDDNPFDGFAESDDNFGDDTTQEESSNDDNPFGGDDSGSSDFGGNDDSNPFGGDSAGGDGNPFGGGDSGDSGGFDFDSADDNSDSFFGDSSDSENSEKKKPKEIKLDRKKVLEEEYDINKQVRAVFPKRFLQLQDVIKANISMCERAVVQDNEHIELFDEIINEYNRLANIVDEYLAIIIEKPHDDIFTTYFTIYANLSRLKDIYNDLLNNNGKNS